MRILVVDDDRAVRESLRRSWSSTATRSKLAATCGSALEAIIANRPDAMVLDVMMPRLDGSRWRAACAAPATTCDLVLTARDTVSDRVSANDNASDACPFCVSGRRGRNQRAEPGEQLLHARTASVDSRRRRRPARTPGRTPCPAR